MTRIAYMWKSSIRLLLSALLCVVLVGCGLGGGVATTTQTRQADGYTWVLERPQQAELLKSYDLVVTITDSAGAPVENASVYFDMNMPSMPMGQNQPLADALGGGRYKTTSIFNMEGDWLVTINATIDGAKRSAAFDQPVVPQ